ncbi:hypothetical protein L6164_018001 [Bauhinia variegata]|uniref:Uncharacterized protein n=1 Tax=Bauhinia variegata TaxID=167791 RepID=A0ACB9NB08_BAUVA|nr:hypothetical protein L6164_018001 [Bauhinia variegata]
MSVLYSPTPKYSDGELKRNPEMGSSIGHPQQCHQPNSGLLRYRSAPSSFFANLVDNSNHGCLNEGAYGHSNYVSSSSAEMETMLAKLISSNNGWGNSASLNEHGEKPVKQEAGESVPPHNCYPYASQMIYQNQQVQGFPSANLSGGNAFDASFGVSENSTQSKLTSRNCSNLSRQKSSPAGFLSNFSVENGFAGLREGASFRARDVTNGQSDASTSGLNSHMKFSSCSRRMPQIAENGNESMESSCVDSRNLGNDNGSSKCFVPSFTSDFWDSSAFNGQKTASDNDEIMFSTSGALETQDSDFGFQNRGLAHHLSLPSSSTKMTIEKFLQVQGSVPCKIRAKRGFATHPRSIAERVRRTRISERIKKLHDFFPKSDKQTSTADMLDLAVDYIKELQNQVKMLTETKAKCTCSSNQKQYSRASVC